MDLAELVAATGGDPAAREIPLNFGLPRVRAMFGDGCLVRPGDRVVAVEPGRNEERTFRTFVVRRQKASCPGVSPFALYGILDHAAVDAPLFFAVDTELPAGDRPFAALTTLSTETLPAAASSRLPRLVPYPEDFHVDAYRLPAPSTGTAVVLTRRQPGTDDDHLPNMLLAVFDGATFTPLWTERVDLRNGTGRFSLLGVSDFNADGRPELTVDGVHGRCGYRAVFELNDEGWKVLPLPLESCGC